MQTTDLIIVLLMVLNGYVNLAGFAVGNITAGNLLGCTHGAAHVLRAVVAFFSPLLHYRGMHMAHHIAEKRKFRTTREQRRTFMTTPFSGLVGIAVTCFVVSFGISLFTFIPIHVGIILLLSIFDEVSLPWIILSPALSSGLGAISFFVLYEMVHQWTHSESGLLISKMHLVHHAEWDSNYGIFPIYNIGPAYFMDEFIALLTWFYQIEQWVSSWWPGFRKAMENMVKAGEQQLTAAKAL